MAKRLTQEEFLKKLWENNEYYRNKSFKVIDNYKTVYEPILVQNKYGICKIRPVVLYEGGNITKRLAIDKTKYTIEQFKEIHKDTYDYSKFKYINNKTKGIIICKIHGDFYCCTNAHLSMKTGCSKCSDISSAKLRTKTIEQFIKDANLVHGDKYNYNKVNYITSHIKVDIICKVHGKFSQKPYAHLSGKNGCQKCNEWKDFKKRWINIKTKYGILYICKFYSDIESFIKIGITSNSVMRRYCGKGYEQFRYEIIDEVKIKDKNIVWNLEEQLKELLKNNKYLPIQKFVGYSECYNIEDLKTVYGEFKKVTEGYITKKV